MLILAISCSRYDDAWITDRLEEVDQELQKLERLCTDYNTNISSLKNIIAALEENDIIEDVLYLPENNSLTLVFSKKGEVTLSIKNGKDGNDAWYVPQLSVNQSDDGLWCWTLDGEWLFDDKGNKIPVNGEDGAQGTAGTDGRPGTDGLDGTPGQDGIVPQVKIEEGYWYISYDNGLTWNKLCKATGESGEDGVDGDWMISDFYSDGQYVYLSLNDGIVLTMPMAVPLLISISEPPVNIKAGQTFSLIFEISGVQGRPEVTCVGEHGWKGKILWESDFAGKLNITAPEVLRGGKVVLFVTYGDYTAMKSVNFNYGDEQSGVMTLIGDYYEVDGSGGVVRVTMITDQEFTVDIPTAAQDWVTYVNTKAVRNEEVILGIAPIRSGEPARTAVITFKGDRINRSITITQRSKILLDSEIELEPTDGFDNTQDGIVVLQTASKGSGTDIIIMGDGFSKRDFVQEMNYKAVMEQTYEDFFSIEPYASLKEYFNVYYINAVSEDAHDATPYFDSDGNQNGAVNGNANTCFSTVFKPGSTSISGDNDEVIRYAKQALRYKGGPDGDPCNSESEINARINKSLMIVMSNVECYAGTCVITWMRDPSDDYGASYSIAYCSLGNGKEDQRRLTVIHEAGGHGFGKLADEYEASTYTSFSTSEWYELRNLHSYGIDRNVNEYWTYEESLMWSSLDWEYTTEDNVYWAPLLNCNYDYEASEGLGIYKGGDTYSNMFCRSSVNSVMRNQHSSNGQYFNAISRWAIWYRVMRLTSSTSSTDFNSSITEFLEFDKNIEVNLNQKHSGAPVEGMADITTIPLGKPEYKEVILTGEYLLSVE